nr:MAG TPA: hypothetical protein [Caudoviricetes sp.]
MYPPILNTVPVTVLSKYHLPTLSLPLLDPHVCILFNTPEAVISDLCQRGKYLYFESDLIMSVGLFPVNPAASAIAVGISVNFSTADVTVVADLTITTN